MTPCVRETVPCVEGQPGAQEWQHSGQAAAGRGGGAAVVWEREMEPAPDPVEDELLAQLASLAPHDVLAAHWKCSIRQSPDGLVMTSSQLRLHLSANS